MYILFCQKKKGATTPFPLTKYLHDFLVDTQAQGIIVSPGFLSRTQNSAESFLEEFLKDTNVNYFGIGNQCNYNPTIWSLTPAQTMNVHMNYLATHNGQNRWLAIDRDDRSDHRKMIFVFRKRHDAVHLPNMLDRNNYRDFIRQIEIIGVVIGSSNFSKNTYIPSRPADKGEADLMMFLDDNFADSIMQSLDGIDKENHSPDVVLSRSMSHVPRNYFDVMLMETLEYILR